MGSLRHVLFVLLVFPIALAPPTPAGAPLKVSDYGDLQTAIDAAEDGDSILLDIDTPGATLDRRLRLFGRPSAGGGGWIFSDRFGGLLVEPGASGSELLNLQFDTGGGPAIRTGPQVLGAADDVTVRGCTIAGIHGGIVGAEARRWRIEHNTFTVSSGPAIVAGLSEGWRIEHNSIVFGSSFGLLVARSDHFRIRYNTISGKISSGTGISVPGGSGHEIVHNEISIEPQFPGSVVSAVSLGGDPSPLREVTVAMNNFRGTMNLQGLKPVFVVGFLDVGGDLTGLAAFEYVERLSAPASTVAIGGNLLPESSDRGELSLSEVPVDELIHPGDW